MWHVVVTAGVIGWHQILVILCILAASVKTVATKLRDSIVWIVAEGL